MLLIDLAIVHDKGRIKIWGFFAKKKDKDGDVVVKNIYSYVIKKLFKNFINIKCLAKSEYLVFNIKQIVVLQNIKSKTTYAIETVEVD